ARPRIRRSGHPRRRAGDRVLQLHHPRRRRPRRGAGGLHPAVGSAHPMNATIGPSDPDSMPGSRWDLLGAEDAGWSEIGGLVESLSPGQAEQPGYFPEGWSVKDLVAHLGSWLAEAGLILERIDVGTYRPEEVDVDRMNEEFREALREAPYPVIRA